MIIGISVMNKTYKKYANQLKWNNKKLKYEYEKLSDDYRKL